jgi:hypothetical protein
VDYANKEDPISMVTLVRSNAYDKANSNKFFLSLDLKSANFNVMRYFDKELVLHCATWDELIRKFTNVNYFIKNKVYRQKIFWQLEPAKQRKIQEWCMTRVLRELVKENIIEKGSTYNCISTLIY